MHMKKDDVDKVRDVVESMGISNKASTTYDDIQRVSGTLMGQGDISLSLYISNLSPYEFDDLIVNTIYG